MPSQNRISTQNNNYNPVTPTETIPTLVPFNTLIEVDDENTPPTPVIGHLLPPLIPETIAALNGYVPEGYNQAILQFGREALPADLLSVDSDKWLDGKYVGSFLKYTGEGRCTKDGMHIPKAIICAGKSVDCKLFLGNWWGQRTKAEQNKIKDDLKIYFLHPTKSATPQKTKRLSAKGAAIAASEGVPFQVVAICDNSELRQQFAQNSESRKKVDKIGKRKSYKHAPKSNGQMFDDHFHESANAVAAALGKLCLATVPQEGLSAYVVPTFCIETHDTSRKRDVYSFCRLEIP